MWQEPRWKFLCSYNEGVYIAKCNSWPLWLLGFPHDCSTSYEISTDVTLQLHLCVHWTLKLHYIWLQEVCPIVVMWQRQLMKQLDMTLLTCTSWLWCPCQDTMLLSDGCTPSVLHLHPCMEKCREVFDGLSVSWWSHACLLLLVAWCAMCIHPATS